MEKDSGGEKGLGAEKFNSGMEETDNKQIFFMGGDETIYRPMFQISDDDGDREDVSTIKVGVCAMAKKSNSKPMREILKRLENFKYIEMLVFEEDVILNCPIEEWPIVDVLISFFSMGFPLDKAIAYKNLRNVYVINDLESQKILLDRREVYQTLVKEGIPHPRYAVYDKDGNGATSCTYTHSEDCIDVGGIVFQKPFVEKPVSAEDHNVYIYFPVAAGGGSQRLFRKVGPRSSVYSNVNRVRSSGSYIYEDFMPTDGTDVKVYTVGPDYAHAEARKSPALDGKVERDKEGKEIRYPVILSAKEKLLARKVCLAFKQSVCGFDLLRANGKSYVCDVNGFSFVKNSIKYYDDCAKILGTMIMRALAPQRQIPWVLGAAPEDIPVVPTTSGSMMELRSVVAVIRHGDRTPKQKMKMEVKHKKFFDLFKKYDGYRSQHLKLKKPKQLQEVLDIARFLLSEHHTSSDPEIAEKKVKLQQLKLVLEMYGHFSGINRKVQLKYQPYGHPKKSSSEEDDSPRQPSLLLIVKWGGELTPAGKIQAEDLGKAFRTLYPGGQGQFEAPGLGFLRLHSTFRHDLKIYASDEGRVQMTAAAFAKGLLALEGELTPILVQMVKSANTNGLLDKQGENSKYQHIVKDRLMNLLNENKDFTEADYDKLASTRQETLINALHFIKNPRKMCEFIHDMVRELTSQIRRLKLEHRTRDLKLYHGESWELLIRRWAKLEKDFRMKDGRFDISKIPDIYDCIKYDLQHNQATIQYSKADDLFKCSRAMADIVIPQEYGISVSEKQHISQSLCTPLMRKIHSDLQQCVSPSDDEESTRLDSKYSKDVASPERFVRTRLYFTSESHIHSLLNMLRYGGLCDEMKDEQWMKAMNYIGAIPELNYMTQIVIMMFEDPSKDLGSDERFHIELHFSPGAITKPDKVVNFPLGSGCRTMSMKGQQENDKPLDELDAGSRTGLSHPPECLPTEIDSPRRLFAERPLSAPMVIQETVEELNEADMFNHSSCQDSPEEQIIKSPKPKIEKMLNVEEAAQSYKVPEPTSPDPSVPAWDWGDDTETSTHEVPNSDLATGHKEGEKLSKDPSETKSPSTPVPSDPIEIQSPRGPKEPVRSQSFEEKRSRSLEDKTDAKDTNALVDRHYLTVHLPIASNKHRHSWASLFCVNPESMQGFEDLYYPALTRARSVSSALGQYDNAFGGFNMVPTLRPLETLHNKLTMKDLDDFLSRATTSKFITPISSPPLGSLVNTPAVSPRPQLPIRARVGQSLPSSSNSSAGPSSPTSASTPMDLVNQLRLYILDSKMDQDLDQSVIKRNRTKSEGSERTVDSGQFEITSTPNSDIKTRLPCSQHGSSASTPDAKLKLADTTPTEYRNTGRYTVSQIDDSVLSDSIDKASRGESLAGKSNENTINASKDTCRCTAGERTENQITDSKNGQIVNKLQDSNS